MNAAILTALALSDSTLVAQYVAAPNVMSTEIVAALASDPVALTAYVTECQLPAVVDAPATPAKAGKAAKASTATHTAAARNAAARDDASVWVVKSAWKGADCSGGMLWRAKSLGITIAKGDDQFTLASKCGDALVKGKVPVTRKGTDKPIVYTRVEVK